MSTFDFNAISLALDGPEEITSGVDFSGKSLKLDTAKDAEPIVEAINACPNLQFLTLTGNTLGVAAARALASALARRPELKVANFSDMFTGRMKTEIPPALSALGEGMISAGARLSVLELSDNAFGPIGVEGLAALLQSEVCTQLEELRLNNNGLGVSGGRLLAGALSARPRRLRTFVAGRNRLENDGAAALARVFQDMGSLRELAMPQNGIYPSGVAALAEALRRNPGLSALDLNDNTIGSKGAASIARALPTLKNLKRVNFGDCLLRSAGARTLAAAFRDNSTLIESVDLSHNEIGREACMDVVEALTCLSGAGDRLAKVVLTGNRLGGAAGKRSLREKLGDAAELSDGADSDDQDVTDESECSEAESECEHSDGSDSESHSEADPQPAPAPGDVDIALDTSIVQEVESDVGRFLQTPTQENLDKLGPRAAELIDAHLQAIKDPAQLIQAYVDATLLVSGLPAARDVATAMYSQLGAYAARPAAQWLLTDCVLRGLALIKSEDKEYKIRWSLASCYAALGVAAAAPAFPPALRDVLKFFMSRKLPTMAPEVRAAALQTCLLDV